MKYTALTIGPIIRSLEMARRTKELWAASCFYSFFMKEVITHLDQKHAVLVPHIVDSHTESETVGVYPDRLILQSEKGLYDELKKAVDAAIKTTAQKFGIPDTKELAGYLTKNLVEFELYATDKGNPIEKANRLLALTELQASYTPEDKDVFLKMLQKIDQTEIYNRCFGKGKHFPSIPAIATRGLKNVNNQFDDEADEMIWEKIKKDNDDFKNARKYIAIVQADGDNVGKLIGEGFKSNDSEGIRKFSGELSSFASKAAKKIKDYGGETIYAGGDDLLFFAPVVNASNNIFSLIGELDALFSKEIAEKYADKKLSMSYGLSITYHKYPMHEALAEARNLLFGKAKNDGKNKLACRIMKHSGQLIDLLLDKPWTKMLDRMLLSNTELKLSSVMYNMENHKVVLNSILSDKEKLENYFENFYNELGHKEHKTFFDDIINLLLEALKKCKDKDKVLPSVFAQLRTIDFLNDKGHE